MCLTFTKCNLKKIVITFCGADYINTVLNDSTQIEKIISWSMLIEINHNSILCLNDNGSDRDTAGEHKLFLRLTPSRGITFHVVMKMHFIYYNI